MTAADVRPLRSDRPYLPGCPGWDYQRDPGMVFKVGTDREGNRRIDQILEWCPIVRARLVTMRPDGTPDGRYYRLTVGEDTIVASHKEVRSGEIWDRTPDAYGTDSRTMRDVLTAIITEQAAGLPRTMAVTHTGWHATPEGGRVYVYPDGRTYPAGADAELVGAPERLAAAAAPVPAVDDQTARAALSEITARGGWAPLFGLATGARALGQSLRPVPAALIVHGDPHTGKSSTAAAGRMLMLAADWPPVATGRFGDTATALECSVDFEGDIPTLLDDLALTADASGIEQRIAREQLERIIRPVGNQEAIRDRRRKDMGAQERRYVRSIPVATAQHLPTGMQASLFRRAVVIRLDHGDVALRWWRDHAPTVGPALRTIGDRIIARLGTADDPGALLATAQQTALAVLGPYVDRELPGWAHSVDGMGGVVECAAGMLSGLVLIAEAAGVDAGPMLETVAAPLARALAVQAAAMDDRRQATDDLRTAIGDIIRRALMDRRAHVTDEAGEYGPGHGPEGLSYQEMGLRATGRSEVGLTVFEAAGPGLMWVPDRGGLAVRSSALYDLSRASGDPRAAGYTAGSIGAALGRSGALVASAQKGRAWSHGIRRPGAARPERYLIVRTDTVWPDLGEDPAPPEGGRATAPAPAPPGPSDHPAPAPEAGPVDVGQDHGQDHAAVPESAGQPPCVETNSAPVEIRPAEPARAVGADTHGLYLPDGRTVPGPFGTLPALLTAVLEVMPTGGTVAIDGELAEALGYPARPVNDRPGKPGEQTRPAKRKGGKSPQECRAVVDGRAAGWAHSAAGIGAWTAWHGPDRPSVAVVVLPWLDPKRMRVSGIPYLRADDDPITAAYLLDRYRELAGVPYVMTAGTSGTNMIRAAYTTDRPVGRGRRRRTPRLKWDGAGGPASAIQEKACEWQRDPGPEADLPYVIGYDARMAYLAAQTVAVLAVDALEPTGLPAAGFDPAVAGYWQVGTDWRPFPELPALTGRPEGSGPYWLTTPTVALLLETGMPEAAVTDAWTATGPAPASGRLLHGSPGVAERLRDAIRSIPADTPDADESRVREALKATYRETYGMLRRGTPWVHRPDWSDTINATARTTLLRKVIKVGTETGRWPVKIDTDCVYYATRTNDPAAEVPPAWVLGDRLGQWAAKHVMTMAEYLEREAPRA